MRRALYIAAVLVLAAACVPDDPPPELLDRGAAFVAEAKKKGTVAKVEDSGHPDAPLIQGTPGRRMPEGYVTRFTGLDGPVEIPYTQLSGGTFRDVQYRMTFKGRPRRRSTDGGFNRVPKLDGVVSLNPGLKSYAELRGRKMTGGDAFDLRNPMAARMFTVTLEDGYTYYGKGVIVSVEKVTESEVVCRFTGEFFATRKLVGKAAFTVTDGTIRAFPAVITMDTTGDKEGGGVEIPE